VGENSYCAKFEIQLEIEAKGMRGMGWGMEFGKRKIVSLL